MRESSYNPWLLLRSRSLRIVRMQSDNKWIPADDNFASTKREAMKFEKIMTKDKEYLTPAHKLKFNRASIKLNWKWMFLSKESHVGGVVHVITHATNSTNFRRVTRNQLSPEEWCLAQNTRSAYILFCVHFKPLSIFLQLVK